MRNFLWVSKRGQGWVKFRIESHPRPHSCPCWGWEFFPIAAQDPSGGRNFLPRCHPYLLLKSRHALGVYIIKEKV